MMITPRLRRRILCIGLPILLGIAAGCQRQPTAKESADYVKSIEELRQAKDKFFREEAKSPLPAAAKANFGGLSYYPTQVDYRIEVTAKPYDKQETVEMFTSQGTTQTYIRYASANFYLQGQPVRVTIYATKTENGLHYFLPFKDKTNGTETYPAGRYLEVEIGPQWKTVVDFNQAYNPYCAYNHDYACPMPPAENHLKIPIRAGERYSEPKS